MKVAYKNIEFVNFKLYLPYYALLLTFILSYFILTSQNYASLLQYYIDQEIAIKRRNQRLAIKQKK